MQPAWRCAAIARWEGFATRHLRASWCHVPGGCNIAASRLKGNQRSRNQAWRPQAAAPWRELISLLQEADRRWAGEEWNLHSAEDIAAAHRSLMHILDGAVGTMFENDPAAPVLRRIVTPTRKFTGDNSDAIYFDAPVSSQFSYVLRGEMNGAVYMSVTLEEGTENGGLGTRTAGIINDTGLDIDAQGRFEIYLGGRPETGTGWASPRKLRV